MGLPLLVDKENPRNSRLLSDDQSIEHSILGLKKKREMSVSPFPTDPKFWKIRVIFFFFFFFNSQFCIFKRIVKMKCENKMSEYIATVPEIRHFSLL